MKLFSISTIFLVSSLFGGLLPLVSAQEEPDACEAALQARVDCYDSDDYPISCDPLPIPAVGFGPNSPDPSKGYFIQELRTDLHAVSEGSYFAMVGIANRSKRMNRKNYELAIFDFPEGGFVQRDETGQVIGNSFTNAVDEIVQEVYGLEPEEVRKVQMVYSHGHMDHIGGATIMYNHILETYPKAVIEIIGSESVQEEFDERIDSEWEGSFSFRAPLPTTVIKNKKVNMPIGRSLKYSLTPAYGHSGDKDLIVFFEASEGESAVMMFIDVIFPGWAPFFSFAISTDIFQFREVHHKILEEFDFGEDGGHFVGGHLTKIGTKADIEMSLALFDAIIAGAQKGLQTADPNAIAAEYGIFDPSSPNVGNQWLLFDLYFKDVVKVCAKEVLAEFGCKVAALDIVLDSHCRSAQSYLRVDF